MMYLALDPITRIRSCQMVAAYWHELSVRERDRGQNASAMLYQDNAQYFARRATTELGLLLR